MKCLSISGKRNSAKNVNIGTFSLVVCCIMIVFMAVELCIFRNQISEMRVQHEALANKLSDCVSQYSTLEARLNSLETSPSPSVDVTAYIEKPETKEVASTPTPTASVTPVPTPTTKPSEDSKATLLGSLFNSASERDYVERVVMQESGNQPLKGQMAVAQCIKDSAVDRGMSAYEVVTEKNQYAPPYKYEVNDSVKEACARVFDNGETVSSSDIKYFYSTVGGYRSSFHENRYTYVMTIKDHRFFM